MVILDGKQTAAAIKKDIAKQVEELVAKGYRRPCLVAVLVGEDGASKTYVANKEMACKEVGFDSEVLRFPAGITQESLLKEIKRLNEITNVKLGNIIEIDSNFTYKKGTTEGADGLGQCEATSQKIGYNSASIKTTFDFGKSGKPVLLVGEADDKSELENTAAIRRKGKKDKTE